MLGRQNADWAEVECRWGQCYCPEPGLGQPEPALTIPFLPRMVREVDEATTTLALVLESWEEAKKKPGFEDIVAAQMFKL